MENLSFQTYRGKKIGEVLEPLGDLRIAVFREFPYLYEGTPEHEMEYLKTYVESDSSFLFTVWQGDEMVGATTCTVLTEETPEVQQPFLKASIPLNTVYYFGESILLPRFRGMGLGVRFFKERENHALELGSHITAFCAVERPADHSLRPKDYKDLSEFWRHRGYTKSPDLVSYFRWKDIDQPEETTKKMEYWTKRW